MCNPAAAVMAVSAVATFFQSKETARKSESMQQDVIDQNARDRAAAPPPQSQGAQQPDERARRSTTTPGPGGGGAPSGTMLTGSGGVTTDLLNLGKNTLLGQ